LARLGFRADLKFFVIGPRSARSQMSRADANVVEKRRYNRDLLLLNLAYGLCILASFDYSSLLPAIGTDLNISTSAVAYLASIAAIASGIGKFALSGAVATLGAKACFGVMLSCQVLACGSLAAATTFSGVLCCALASDVAVCILWPASVDLMQEVSDSAAAQSQAIWGLGIASRIAAAVAGPGFAALVKWFGWRCASALSILPCIVSAISVWSIRGRCSTGIASTLKAHSAEPNCKEQDNTFTHVFAHGEAITNMLKDGRVWMCAGASSCLTGIKVFDTALVPLYIKENVEHGLVNNALAISLGPSFTLGVLFSVVVFGFIFTRMSGRKKVVLLTGLNCVSVSCMLAIALDSAFVAKSLVHVYIRCVLLAGAGLGLGLSLYQPVGIFALRIGGGNSSLLAGVMDGLSYLWSFVFVRMVGLLVEEPGGWTRVWWLCLFCYVCAMLFTHSYATHLFPSRDD